MTTPKRREKPSIKKDVRRVLGSLFLIVGVTIMSIDTEGVFGLMGGVCLIAATTIIIG
jgi:hypothetical protein